MRRAPWRAQIYNQIYNRTLPAFNGGSSAPLKANALNYTSPVLSSAIISVVANTQYFYQVSDSAGICTGPIYSFVSAPGAQTLRGCCQRLSEGHPECYILSFQHQHDGLLATRWDAACASNFSAVHPPVPAHAHTCGACQCLTQAGQCIYASLQPG